MKSHSAATSWHRSGCHSLSHRDRWQSRVIQTWAGFFKSVELVCVCLFVLESRRGQHQIAARQFPFSKMEVSPALHSIQCGSRGYPVKPMITREIKSLPQQLFDSGRKRKSLLPRVCSPHHPLGHKCRMPCRGWLFPLHSQEGAVVSLMLRRAQHMGSIYSSAAWKLGPASRAGMKAELQEDRD